MKRIVTIMNGLCNSSAYLLYSERLFCPNTCRTRSRSDRDVAVLSSKRLTKRERLSKVRRAIRAEYDGYFNYA